MPMLTTADQFHIKARMAMPPMRAALLMSVLSKLPVGKSIDIY
jgi:uncharacterized protein (DUF2249 family)